MVRAATRAAPSHLLCSTACPSWSPPDSSPGVAIRSLPGPVVPPTCNDESATAEDPSCPWAVSRCVENDLPPATAATAAHLACHASAAVNHSRESSPHLLPTLRAPSGSAIPETTDSCPWPRCQPARARKNAGRTSPHLPKPVPAFHTPDILTPLNILGYQSLDFCRITSPAVAIFIPVSTS